MMIGIMRLKTNKEVNMDDIRCPFVGSFSVQSLVLCYCKLEGKDASCGSLQSWPGVWQRCDRLCVEDLQ